MKNRPIELQLSFYDRHASFHTSVYTHFHISVHFSFHVDVLSKTSIDCNNTSGGVSGVNGVIV